MSIEPLIVVAGENLIDRIIRPDGRIEEIPGGGPFNTACALGRLGCRVAYLGRISTDDRGRLIRRLLLDDGVDLSLAVATDDPTLLAHASLDGTGNATYRFDWQGSAAAGLRADDLPAGLPGDAAALHVGTLGLVLEPMATTIEGVVAGAPSNVLVMVDPNIRPGVITDPDTFRRRMTAILRRADVVKVSLDDLAWLVPDSGNDEAARAATDAALVLVTDGARPVRILRRDASAERFDIPPVTVVDTIGAGDAFGAGFLAEWIRAGRHGDDLRDAAAVRDAVQYAVRVAAWTVGRAGADPPRLADLGDDGWPGR
ncbi:MAG TPA: PfkB family carbohydrate kinase [Candidatus Limnocylindrales bacterium]